MTKDLVQTINRSKIELKHGASIYSNLRSQLIDAGILDRSYYYYTLLITTSIAGYFGSIFMFYKVSIFSLEIFFAVLTGFFAVQIGGIMHDAAHRAIFNSVKNNDLIGQLSAGLIVMSYENWKKNHNAHHANPNEEGEDPDLEIPLHVFTNSQLSKRKGFRRFITKFQVLTYYTMRPLTSVSTRVNSFIYFVKNYNPDKNWQIIMFLAGVFLWFIGPFIAFGTLKGFIFVVASNAFGGFYSSNIFAPNHKGMPQIMKGTKISFFEQQVVTSRNVTMNPISDFVYLGLNYQIEHHLFPACPRNKLYKAAYFTKKAVEDSGLSYTVEGVISSNKIILSALSNTAKRV